MPRANLWGLAVPVLMVLDAVGLADVPRDLLSRTADELDRLAEHLIGETAPELQHYKQRIQVLISRVAPHRREVEIYIQTYCRVR